MPATPPGSDWDARGCIASAGYSWCQILGRCLRAWEEACAIPDNCLTWHDGCNMCSVENGKLTVCTQMMCFAQGTPQCQVWAPGVPNIMPVIDYPMPVIDYPMPMDPPVINPFIGDGH